MFRAALLKLFRCQVLRGKAFEVLAHGTEPVIVTCNHQSFLDGVLVSLASPRYLYYGVESDYSIRHPVTSRILNFLSLMGLGKVIAIDVNHPFGLRTLAKAISRDKCSVMIFPEGRIKTPGEDLIEKPGVNWLSRQTGASVLKIRIRGADQSRFFGRCGQAFWPKIYLRF